jgi:thiol-disulfide isomerase/thioredoxin
MRTTPVRRVARNDRVLARAALLALSAVAVACAPSGPAATGPVRPHPLLGAPAPAFDLPARIGGPRVRVPAPGGAVTLVDFWATWCDACKRSMPYYAALSERWGPRLAIVGLSEDEDDAEVATWAARMGVRFPTAWDAGHEVASAYRPDAMPTAFVIDRGGIVRHVQAGFEPGDERAIESAIAALVGP